MKKAAALILIALLGISLFAPMAYAASAKAAISLSSSSVTVGNTITVTIKYTADEGIGSWEFNLNYNKEYLEYVSGAHSGGAGVLRFVDSRDEDNLKTVTQTATFRTLKVGNTTVSTSNSIIAFFHNNSVARMNVTDASASIKINAKPEASTNANLSSLKVSPGTLSPEFSSSTTDYKMSVDYSVTSIAVSGVTAHSAATKSLSSTALKVGENKITLTVTAESGAKKTYTITVTRSASALADVAVTIGAVTYSVVYEKEELKAPEGFTETKVKYKNDSIPAFQAPENLFKLVCLSSPSNEKLWFMYDEASSVFTKYISVVPASKSYILLDMPQGEAAPKGYELRNVAVNGKDFVYAFINVENEADKVLIVYAMTLDGKKGLYLYDTEEKTFMRSGVSPDSQVNAAADDMADSYEVLSSKLAESQKDLRLSQVFMLVISALFAVLIVLCAAYIIKDRKSKKEEQI